MKCKLLRIKKNEEKSNENYICSKSGDFAQQVYALIVTPSLNLQNEFDRMEGVF
jgi:hypothetical protein